MKIILTQDVPNLGSLGDEVQVKDGYARNYLLPRGMALGFHDRQAGLLQHRKRAIEAERKKAMSSAQEVANELTRQELIIESRAGSSGRLYGSVTNRDVQAALEALGYVMNRRRISLPEPIRQLGLHEVILQLHSTVKVPLRVRVQLMEEDDDPAPPEEAQDEEASFGEVQTEEMLSEEAQAAQAVPLEQQNDAPQSDTPQE